MLLDNYKENELIGIIYFIDSGLSKNKNYYIERLKKNEKKIMVLNFIYFMEKSFLIFFNLEWKELINYLIKWKGELPDLPEINFDKEAENTFLEIKKNNSSDFFLNYLKMKNYLKKLF